MRKAIKLVCDVALRDSAASKEGEIDYERERI